MVLPLYYQNAVHCTNNMQMYIQKNNIRAKTMELLTTEYKTSWRDRLKRLAVGGKFLADYRVKSTVSHAISMEHRISDKRYTTKKDGESLIVMRLK